MSKKISEVFDVEPVSSDVRLPSTQDEITNSGDVSDDADLARKNIRSMLDVGNRALENAYEVAIQSESPRAYEVLSTMLKTMTDINGQLLDIHEKKKRVLASKELQSQTNVTNNVAFVGTTAELNRIIMERISKQ